MPAIPLSYLKMTTAGSRAFCLLMKFIFKNKIANPPNCRIWSKEISNKVNERCRVELTTERDELGAPEA